MLPALPPRMFVGLPTWAKRMRGWPGPGRDTGTVLGTDFARTLRAAQAGEEDAFARLWRDANPAMIRYLRVVGHDDPYDEACEGWVTVVRGLPGFAGDELAWRVWLLACARQRAEESTLRRAWGSVTVLPGVHVGGDGEIDIDELLEPDEAGDPSHRGINDTLTALRALPLGQGEAVVLHLGADLPNSAVADVVGVDEVNIERAQTRALERLGTDVDLLTWSLAAPPTPAELADEKVALSAFRKILSRGRRSDRAKVIAIGVGLGYDRAVVGGTASDLPGGRSRRSDDIRGGQAGRRSDLAPFRGANAGATAAGRSRTAVLTVTALSVSAMSLGGLGAAAYVGVLPDRAQQAMHDAVGAPAPKARGNDTSQNPGTAPTAGVGPHAAESPAAGLCRAWAVDKTNGTARDRSVAFRNLAGTAGGADQVEAYCAVVLVPKPTKGSATSTTGATPSSKPPHPTKPPTTKTPNPNSPTKGGQPATKGKSAATSASTTAPSDMGATTNGQSPNPRSTGKGPKTTGTQSGVPAR